MIPHAVTSVCVPFRRLLHLLASRPRTYLCFVCVCLCVCVLSVCVCVCVCVCASARTSLQHCGSYQRRARVVGLVDRGRFELPDSQASQGPQEEQNRLVDGSHRKPVEEREISA